MNFLKKICIFFSFSLLIILIILILMLNTDKGLFFLFKSTSYYIPGFELHSIKGNWHNFTVNNLKYKSSNINFYINKLHVSFSLKKFLKNKLCINDIVLNNASIELNIHKFNRSKISFINNNKLLNIFKYKINQVQLKKFLIQNIFIKLNDNSNIKFQDFEIENLFFSNSTFIINKMYLNELSIQSPYYSSKQIQRKRFDLIQYSKKFKEKNILLNKNLTLMKEISKIFDELLLSSSFNFIMPFNIKLKNFYGKNWYLNNKNNLLLKNIHLQAESYNSYLNLILLKINFPNVIVTINGNLSFIKKWLINGIIDIIYNENFSNKEHIQLNISGALRNELCINTNCLGLINAKILLKANLTKIGMPIKIIINSKSIDLNFNKIEKYQIKNFFLSINGKIQNYNLACKATLNGNNIPSIDIDMKAKGNNNSFSLSSLILKMLEGYINVTAYINWNKTINFFGSFNIHNVNTVNQWPTWPAILAGKINVTSNIKNNVWQFQIPNLYLCGKIKQDNFFIKGCLNKDIYNNWYIPKLLISLGCNHCIIQGNIKDKIGLNIKLNVPMLNQILSHSNGKLIGNAKLYGDIKTPKLFMQFDLINFNLDFLNIKRIKLKTNLQLDTIVYGNMLLEIDQLQQNEFFLKKLIMTIAGKEIQHNLKLIIQGKSIDTKLDVNGIYDRTNYVWHGLFNALNCTASINDMYLIQKFILYYKNLLEKTFINFNHNSYPDKNKYTFKNISKVIHEKLFLITNSYNIKIPAIFTFKNLQINGNFSGETQFIFSKKDIFKFNLLLTSDLIEIKNIQKQQISPLISLDMFKFNINIKNGIIDQLNYLINIKDYGQLNLFMQIKDYSKITGFINIKQMPILSLKPILVFCDNLEGLLNVKLTINGNIEQPKFYGYFKLNNFFVKGNIPFIIDDCSFIINFYGTNAKINGMIKTNTGQLNLIGNFDWNSIKNWRMYINLKGNQIKIDIASNLKFIISPNITFIVNEKLFTLNGKIDIPWASIEIKKNLNNAINLSNDEVLIDNNYLMLNNYTNNNVTSINLLINIGDDVNISILGVQGKIKGNLNVCQDKHKLMFNGQLNISSGKFHIYGQDLIIHTGQLLFSGPIDHPQINIEAIRNPENIEDNVNVGIRITGFLDELKLEIFSDPLKSQQETLSYLFFGRRVVNTGSDNTMMTAFLIKMGFTQGKQIVEKIGEIFGLSNLDLDIKGQGSTSQVVVSSSIIPSLQIKYNIGIFDTSMTLTIRYYLIPKLYIEIISGINQTLELIYKFEF